MDSKMCRREQTNSGGKKIMTTHHKSPQFVSATEGDKTIQYYQHSNNNQKAFKKLIYLCHQIKNNCYKSYSSKAIIEQALSEIRKIRS
jgi:hypothetical protein